MSLPIVKLEPHGAEVIRKSIFNIKLGTLQDYFDNCSEDDQCTIESLLNQ